MSVAGRLKKLEERCDDQAEEGEAETIVRVRCFSPIASALPSAEEQMAGQRAEGKRVIVVRSP